MYTEFPSIYWDTSCLIVEAGSFSQEDFQGLIEKGVLKPTSIYTAVSNDEDLDNYDIETNAINRDKIATSIAEIQSLAKVEAPDINKSGFGFTADVYENSIKSGLKLVSRIGEKVIYDIIRNRPYTSLDDFLSKVKISKDRVVLLIKAGVFRNIEKVDNITLLRKYVISISDQKNKLNGMNINMLIEHGLFPEELSESIRIFKWWKYVTKGTKATDANLLLDLAATEFYETRNGESNFFYDNNGNTLIKRSVGQLFYEKHTAILKNYIAKNHDELLSKLNANLMHEQWEKYKMDTIPQGEIQSIRMYTGEHDLTKFNLPVDRLADIEPDAVVGEFKWRGKVIPEYKISRVAGTVVAKDKLKENITLLTDSGPIKIKFWKDSFAHYNRKITKVVNGQKELVQDSFFEVGTFLLVYGRMTEGQFLPKYYKRKQKIDDVCFKIIPDYETLTVTTEVKITDADSDI